MLYCISSFETHSLELRAHQCGLHSPTLQPCAPPCLYAFLPLTADPRKSSPQQVTPPLLPAALSFIL